MTHPNTEDLNPLEDSPLIEEIATFQLTDEQSFIIDNIVELLKEATANRIFQRVVLTGEPGTGKTTVMKILKERLGNNDCLFAAPTHAARTILENTVGTKVETVAALLGLAPNMELDDYDPNNPKFFARFPKKMSYFEPYYLLIIDECSMINNFLEEKLSSLPVHILYVGDDAQIRPVNNGGRSSVFDIEPKFALTQILRQKEGSPAFRFSKKVRNNMPLFNMYSDDENYALIVQKIDDMKHKIDGNVTFISYKNAVVSRWNKYVRKHLFGNITEDLVVGEKLLVNQPYRDFLYYTNLKLEVVDVKNSREILFSYTVQEMTKEFLVRVKEVKLKKPTGEIFTHDFVCKEKNSRGRDSVAEFAEYLDYFRQEAINEPVGFKKSARWVEYYAEKQKIMSIYSLVYRGQVAKEDFKYAYAITAHSSQGATIEGLVVIDKKDVFSCRNQAEAKELFIVAASRATSKIIVID